MKLKDIKTVAVIGAGTMRQGLAQSFAQAGYTTYTSIPPILIKEGVVSPEEIDTATKGSYGFSWSAIGVFEGFDMIGIDVLNKVSTLFKLLDTSSDNPKFLYYMVEKAISG
jgi:3-hydroxyacyl-CoA dehydrogenase